jgi:hypothetical protein
MDRNKDIDQFIKSEFDKMEITFNDKHWDKLQQSLLLAETALVAPKVVKKALTISKAAIITTIVAVLIVILVYILSTQKIKSQKDLPAPNQKTIELQLDTVSSKKAADLENPLPINKGLDSLKKYSLPKADSLLKSQTIKPIKDTLLDSNFIFW